MRGDPAPALWAHDRALLPSAGGTLCGLDEVGRGPLAGNVVAACVVFSPDGEPVPGLNDSKKLSPARREALEPVIRQRALAWSLGEATPEEIDRLNILQATFLAMRRALESLSARPALLLVDGSQKIPGAEFPQRTIVGGDALSACVAAASVLAKVHRDRQMVAAEAAHPGYGFAAHKGYGTREHVAAIGRMGVTGLHRKTFCVNILQGGAR
jgi:ribonuclease HII